MANRHFYTVDEYNRLDKANLIGEKYNDRQGRDIIRKLLEQYPLDENVTYMESDGNCFCDILHISKNGYIAIEVKHRFDKCYPTMIIDKVKYDRFKFHLDNGNIKQGLTITIWPNGKIWITDVEHYAYPHYGWYNETTNANDFTDYHKVQKWVMHYKPEQIFYLYMFFNEQTKKWEPIIRTQETSIEALEYEYEQQMNKSNELF